MSGLLWSATSTSPSISQSLPTPRFQPLGIVIGPLVGLKSWGFRGGEPSDRLRGDRSRWLVRSQQIGARANDSTTQWATRLDSESPSPTPLLVEVDSFENPLRLEASGYEGLAVSMFKMSPCDTSTGTLAHSVVIILGVDPGWLLLLRRWYRWRSLFGCSGFVSSWTVWLTLGVSVILGVSPGRLFPLLLLGWSVLGFSRRVRFRFPFSSLSTDVKVEEFVARACIN